VARILLIPGADASDWFWHLLIPRLRERGHNPVAMAMPTDDSATLAAWTRTALDALGPSRDDVVVVAQSIGGFVGPLVCTELPAEQPDQLLILVNAMVPAPGETAGAWWENTGQPAARAADATRVGRAPDAEFDVVADFFHDVPAEVTAEAMASPPRSLSDTFFDDPWPLPAWPAVPTVFLQGRDDRLFPLEFQRRVARERLGIDVIDLPGGHLIALSQPDLLAEAIDAAITSARDARPPRTAGGPAGR
jgi:pimeloyl-ACP methyl ester carboxylesterase